MNDERIHRKALQETIYGKRAVGKPRMRWEAAAREDCTKLRTWNESIENKGQG
jgi:hypothetical protein